MGYKRKTGRKYKRATQVNHKVLKGISAGLTAVLGLLAFRIWRHKNKKGEAMVELLKYMGVENPQGDISLTAVVVWLLVCIVAIGISLWCLDKKNKMSEMAKANIIA